MRPMGLQEASHVQPPPRDAVRCPVICRAGRFRHVGRGLAGVAKAAKSPVPKLGSVLPLPAVTLLDGRVWTPAEVQGKTLVVYWWASWCPFCALQSPHIDALWRAQQANGLEVLALSIDKQAAAAA